MVVGPVRVLELGKRLDRKTLTPTLSHGEREEERPQLRGRWGFTRASGEEGRAFQCGLLVTLQGCWGRQPPSPQPSPSSEREEEALRR